MMPTNKKCLIVSHVDCLDGTVAAWVAYDALRGEEYNDNIKILYATYDQSSIDKIIKEWRTRELDYLYMLDYSVPKEVLNQLEELHPLGSITILDHHKTAFENLFPEDKYKDKDTIAVQDVCSYIYLDRTKSGCLLTWEHFNPDKVPPRLVEYVNDHDLWKKELANAREVSAFLKGCMHMFDTDMEKIYALAAMFSDSKKFRAIVNSGKDILEEQTEIINKAIAKPEPIWIFGLKGKVVFINTKEEATLTSEIGEALYSDGRIDLAIIILHEPELNRYKVSFRSNRTSVGCDVLAKMYGGGGHPGAAGFYRNYPENFIPTVALLDFIFNVRTFPYLTEYNPDE